MFSQCSNAINTKLFQCVQVILDLSNVYKAMAFFLTNISVFNASICYFGNISMHVWVIFDLQMCISNGYGLFASKTSIWQFCLQNHFTRCIGHILAFKHASGHRHCPIACTAFKSVPIITNFSILLSKHFI